MKKEIIEKLNTIGIYTPLDLIIKTFWVLCGIACLWCLQAWAYALSTSV